ncbi:hypothetical protein I552_6936 [Mycobacterium xenopi 3993]|nr:hypothetical protein I552_6936 [Mycobacterium xenopi 3993]
MEYAGDEDEAEAAPPPVGRALLVGSTVGGIVVAGCAALAVAVTVGIRPTAASQPQQPVRQQQKPVPGNFMPVLPPPSVAASPPPQAPSCRPARMVVLRRVSPARDSTTAWRSAGGSSG